MNRKEITDWLIQSGWKPSMAESVIKSGHIDMSIDISEWKKTFVGAICSEHKNSAHIVRYLSQSIGKDIPQWEDITAQSMRAVRNYMETCVTVNSARTYLAIIKATINLNDKAGISGQQLKNAVKTKQMPVQNVSLSEEELQLIHSYMPTSQTERDIKREFMIEAYCGARNSDVENLTERNVTDGKWLTYVSQKTKTKTCVPVHRNLMEYLRQGYGKKHSRKVIIETLQRICKRVGITQPVEIFNRGEMRCLPKYKFVGSHTARRSFASQLALRGIPLAVISKFMGHSSPDMTMRYICIETENISPDVQAFFN